MLLAVLLMMAWMVFTVWVTVWVIPNTVSHFYRRRHARRLEAQKRQWAAERAARLALVEEMFRRHEV